MKAKSADMPKRRRFTQDEYLALEEHSFEKHEYFDGVIYELNTCDEDDPMSPMPKRKYFTEEEYMLLEKASPFKSEYYDGEIFAMAGASGPHIQIVSNLHYRLRQLLEGKPCRPMTNDMMVKIEATGLRAYPDVIVVCDPIEYFDDDKRVLANPKILLEVASESTEKYDRTVKLRHYKQIPSLREFVLVDQDEPIIDVYSRQDDGQWTHATVTGLTSDLVLSSIQQSIPLAQIFEHLKLQPAT